MRTSNIKKQLIAVVGLSFASMLFVNQAAADIIVDPKGKDPAQLRQDQMECRELASSIDFNMASEHQGRPVARGAVIGGSMAAIAGGRSSSIGRAAAGGALVGGIQKNKSRRVDASVQDAKIRDAQRNCLIGRGHSPLN